ncbi:MAG TPA: response regulator [Allosphingosinicella sp.]|jgi:DNA-binding response OmpR family regulator
MRTGEFTQAEATMKRLLIVDDEPAMARLIQRIAKGCGYDVTVTHDAEDFMDAVVAREPDAIALDLSLPGADGVELLRFLGAVKCRAKILIISGFDARVLETTGRLGEARGLNIAGTLMKPVRAAELRAAIEALDAPVSA